jgi:hypothetical protein
MSQSACPSYRRGVVQRNYIKLRSRGAAPKAEAIYPCQGWARLERALGLEHEPGHVTELRQAPEHVADTGRHITPLQSSIFMYNRELKIELKKIEKSGQLPALQRDFPNQVGVVVVAVVVAIAIILCLVVVVGRWFP